MISVAILRAGRSHCCKQKNNMIKFGGFEMIVLDESVKQTGHRQELIQGDPLETIAVTAGKRMC